MSQIIIIRFDNTITPRIKAEKKLITLFLHEIFLIDIKHSRTLICISVSVKRKNEEHYSRMDAELRDINEQIKVTSICFLYICLLFILYVKKVAAHFTVGYYIKWVTSSSYSKFIKFYKFILCLVSRFLCNFPLKKIFRVPPFSFLFPSLHDHNILHNIYP